MSERMTDLERAQALLERMEQARRLMGEEGEFHAGLALIDALAAARREGYDEAVKTYVGVCQQVRKDGAEAERAMWEEGIAQVQHDAYERGAEEAEARLRSSVLFEVGRQQGAEEMRERAAQEAIGGEHYGFIEQDIAAAIRALPLTPEEPT